MATDRGREKRKNELFCLHFIKYTRFELYTVVEIQFVVFWIPVP